MNIDYLYSIINLYLKKEKDNRKTNLNIRKKNDVIEFNFSMSENNPDKTSFTIPLDVVLEKIKNILNDYKQDMMIIDEKYANTKDDCHYSLMFKNGRRLSLDGFSLLEVNNMRNVLYDIKINSEELRLDDLNKEKEMAYIPAFKLQQAGFSSFATLFLVALFLTDVFVIALWIFKALTK